MSERILIIDDELNLRMTLAQIFRRRGHFVTAAANGEEALNSLCSNPYQLCFLDLRLGDMDGLALLPRLLEIQPGLPVLILTAVVSLGCFEEAARRGARGYLLKPVDPEVVIHRAEGLLAESRSHRLFNEISTGLQDLNLSNSGG